MRALRWVERAGLFWCEDDRLTPAALVRALHGRMLCWDDFDVDGEFRYWNAIRAWDEKEAYQEAKRRSSAEKYRATRARNLELKAAANANANP